MIEKRIRTRKDGTVATTYRVIGRWVGYPAIIRSYRTEAAAKNAYGSLRKLWQDGRLDLFNEMSSRKATLPEIEIRVKKKGTAMAELTPDAPVVLRKWTMKELMDEWLTHLGAEGTRSRAHRPYAAGTIQRYKECMRLVVDGLPGGEATNPLEVDLLVMQKALRTVEGATRNRRITAVQSMAKWARREHKLVLPLTSDDYAELKDEEDEPTLERAVTEEELAQVRAASTPEWSDLWLVLARTGLRVGEVQAMKRKNITTVGDRVYVSFTKAVQVEVTKRGKKKKVKRGKSKKAVRRVPVLDPEAAAVLLRLRRSTHSELTPVWPAPQRSYQLARSTWERAMATVGLVHEEAVVAWKRALRSVKRRKAAATYTPATKASIAASRLAARPRPAKGIHGLRHLYGVTLTRIGTPVHLIRLWMGHSSLELTGRYTRAPEEEEEVKHLIEMYRQRVVTAPQTTPSPEVAKKPARTAGKRARV